jgi:hypothetical protein
VVATQQPGPTDQNQNLRKFVMFQCLPFPIEGMPLARAMVEVSGLPVRKRRKVASASWVADR